MNEHDFEFFKDDLDDHPQIGFCPFCGKPGWIAGDDEWCEHYVGTANGYSAAGPLYSSVFPKIDALPISKLWQAKMDELRELSPDELRKALQNVPIEYREYTIKSVEENWTPAAFLDFYKDWKYLEFEVEAFMLSEFYVSYFALDFDKVDNFFATTIESVLEKI